MENFDNCVGRLLFIIREFNHSMRHTKMRLAMAKLNALNEKRISIFSRFYATDFAMREYNNKKLNIKSLLSMGDLDIRGIAAQKKTLTADDYFSKIEQFMEDASQLKKILLNVSRLDENMKALKELESKLGVVQRSLNFEEDSKNLNDLENLKIVLTEIGYKDLNFDIDSISNAIKNGHLQLASSLAQDVSFKLNSIIGRVQSTCLTKKFANAEVKNTSTILLSEALEYLDYLEATRKMRILAVDDVTIVLNMISSVLSPYYEVIALKNSSQIEKVLAHTTPELFLLDIEMSEMNGFDLVPLIREHEEHKDTPIIFLTGNASFNNLKDAVELGACDFITKPVSPGVLMEKIQKNIVRKKAY